MTGWWSKSSGEVQAGMLFRHRNPQVLRLTAAQALAVLAGLGHATFTGLAGAMLAPQPALATVPISFIVVGTLVAALPMSFFMRRHGRRAGFLLAAAAGTCSGLLAALALYWQSFWLLAGAAFCQGIYQAGIQYYRFAAMEAAAPSDHGRAVATVLGGGLVGALGGPWLFTHMEALFAPLTFVGVYLGMAGLGLLATLVLAGTKAGPLGESDAGEGSGRPLSVIMRQPVFICALASAMGAYALMILAMTAAPLHMIACGFVMGDAATAIQWHILAMFLPSFFVGRLIAAWGVNRVLVLGAILFMAGGYTAVLGLALANFQLALALVGVGWNFLFTGGTTMLAQSYHPAERAKVQGVNEVLVFGGSAVSSFLAGTMLATVGWDAINIAVMVGGGLVLCVTLVQWRFQKAAA